MGHSIFFIGFLFVLRRIEQKINSSHSLSYLKFVDQHEISRILEKKNLAIFQKQSIDYSLFDRIWCNGLRVTIERCKVVWGVQLKNPFRYYNRFGNSNYYCFQSCSGTKYNDNNNNQFNRQPNNHIRVAHTRLRLRSDPKCIGYYYNFESFR